MLYELLNVETGNLIGTYPTRAEALAVVRELVRLNGLAYVESLALGYEDQRGNGEQIAEGAELAALARDPDSERVRHTA
jgi:hypothetical protein